VKIIYLITMLAGLINIANAELLVKTPDQACSQLNEIGLKTGSWNQEFGCFSGYKQIGTGAPLANNLAIYYEGNSSMITMAYLMLNINDKPTATVAHKELLKAAEILIKKQAGKVLSKKLSDAIINGANASEKIANTQVEVERSDWPTGRGYEVKVSVK
jgi:hypothetical protein